MAGASGGGVSSALGPVPVPATRHGGYNYILSLFNSCIN